MNRIAIWFLSLAVGSFTAMMALLATSEAVKWQTGFDALSQLRSPTVPGLNTFVVVSSTLLAVVFSAVVRGVLDDFRRR